MSDRKGISFFYGFGLAVFVLLMACGSTSHVTANESEEVSFDKLNGSSAWKLEMNDPCTGNWQSNWFMDGKLAKVEYGKNGMNFIAGPVNRNDAHHAVLWTKQSFKGDLKMEYNFTKTDTQIVNVMILYLQANGVGTGPYDKDISKWNELREVPTMSKYYYNMNALHISYAAYEMVNDDTSADYIRIRKYPAEVGKFDQTEVPPAYFKTGLFKTGITYHITIIKTNTKLFMQVKGDNMKKLFSWDLSGLDMQSVREGRIGLRHMFTRSSAYSDIKVSVK